MTRNASSLDNNGKLPDLIRFASHPSPVLRARRPDRRYVGAFYKPFVTSPVAQTCDSSTYCPMKTSEADTRKAQNHHAPGSRLGIAVMSPVSPNTTGPAWEVNSPWSISMKSCPMSGLD